MDKPARILVVYDDENIRNPAKPIFEDQGYMVDLAATGREAVKRTEGTAYDIALLDVGFHMDLQCSFRGFFKAQFATMGAGWG